MKTEQNDIISPANASRETMILTALLFIVSVTSFSLSILVAGNQQNLQNGLLVLNDGRVMSGQIAVLNQGYLIKTPTGNSSIPFAHVVCFAKSLKEAYRIQRDEMTQPTADLHTALALWCLKQKLFQEAEIEIQSALKLQPNHLPAKKALYQFDQAVKKVKPDFVNSSSKKLVETLLIEKEFSVAKPIGELKPEQAKEFATMIEPLLINRCANTSCHGQETRTDFQLTHKWNLRGNTRHITEQNLNAVISQIDFQQPSSSPLIAVLDGTHGYRNQSVFRGAKAQYHKQALTLWTLQVAESLREEQGIQLISSEKKMTPEDLIPPSGIIPASFEEPAAETDRDVLTNARGDLAHDPFNPDVFNQKVHGK